MNKMTISFISSDKCPLPMMYAKALTMNFLFLAVHVTVPLWHIGICTNSLHFRWRTRIHGNMHATTVTKMMIKNNILKMFQFHFMKMKCLPHCFLKVVIKSGRSHLLWWWWFFFSSYIWCIFALFWCRDHCMRQSALK